MWKEDEKITCIQSISKNGILETEENTINV